MRKLAIVGGARKEISLNEVHCSPLTAMAAETKKNNSDVIHVITVPIAKNIFDICQPNHKNEESNTPNFKSRSSKPACNFFD